MLQPAAPRRCVHPGTLPRSSPWSAAPLQSAGDVPAPPAWLVTGSPGWRVSPGSLPLLYKIPAGSGRGEKKHTKHGEEIQIDFILKCIH